MARLTIESQAAPAAPGPIENQIQQMVAYCVGACAIAASANPGLLAGALAAWVWRWGSRPPTRLRLVVAALMLVPLVALHSFVVLAWLWRDWFSQAFPTAVASVDGWRAVGSFWIEALAGPLWLELMLLMAALWRRRVDAQVRHDHRLDQQRWRAMTGQRQPMLPDPHTLRSEGAQSVGSPAHPDGYVRLGVDAETNRPFDLALFELAIHVLLAGTSGSGKTTTLTRLADGVIANWYGVVIIDCKGGGLGGMARGLAERYGIPFYFVDPDDPDSLGYNPCSGDAASVANKLVGAFTYSPAAEIYKNIGMEAIPVIVRGLQAAGKPVTVDALYAAFGHRGMASIANELDDDEHSQALRERLLNLGDRQGDRTGQSGHSGMQRRLGALREGKFGDLFRKEQMLDWDQALSQPSVVYIALSTLASSEDVELMGRVIAQDLKQVCARRIRAEGKGEKLNPVLAIFDEFAALNEAEQLVDLLLQARQAVMPVVISTQYLPESVPLRQSLLGAGLLIAHRVAHLDAQAIADQLGTRPHTEITVQEDFATGYSEKGSVRRVDQYNVHPNQLRNFEIGQAVVASVPTRRYSIVRVYPDTG